jgi:predicted O-methyltransferase YrrM
MDPSFLEPIRDSEDEPFADIWQACGDHCSMPIETGLSLYRAIRYLVVNKVPGVLVFCGRDPGESIEIAVRSLQSLEATRRFVLFLDAGAETNSGKPAGEPLPPTIPAAFEPATGRTAAVLRAAELTGFDMSRIRVIAGDVSQTAPRASVADVALLALDLREYTSAYGVLRHLYPRLVHQGVLQIDSFPAVRQAVEDYFSDRGPAPLPRPPEPYFHRSDHGRVAVRADEPASARGPELAAPSEGPLASSLRSPVEPGGEPSRYDYLPPGLADPKLIQYFPTLIPGNLRRNRWNFLRVEAPHVWRIDDRSPSKGIGVLSIEEATLLFNLAQPHAGRRGLAIGCHFGWSTAHLLAAGLDLDVVDPSLYRPEQHQAVTKSLRQVPTAGGFRLWAAYSPSIIPAIRAVASPPWSFVFIDGDHEGDAPRLDAEAVLPWLHETAVVVFHDLVSPYVAAGLDVFRNQGWRTQVFNTMQIMGVAWRGDVRLPKHIPDPAMPPLPAHLDHA